MVTQIVLSPFRYGNSLRWGEGDFKTSFHLLTELAGVDPAVLRDLRYPDADRVIEAFFSMLPQDIKTDLADGRIPVKREQVEPPAEVKTNGSGAAAEEELPRMPLTGPGVPLPETGFDLSEEEAP